MAYIAINRFQNNDDPFVFFLAPAWKKFHDQSFSNLSQFRGVIIHGTDDARVPLRWIFELSVTTNLPLIVQNEVDHIGNLLFAPFQESILSYAQPVPLSISCTLLPDWNHRMEYNSKEWKDAV
ncbi:MAG: hypothetical protein CL916_15355 [Deltaproteobacteria bacterium]|nr:hypothetical protein [Deltaproteobacteria bacterium]